MTFDENSAVKCNNVQIQRRFDARLQFDIVGKEQTYQLVEANRR